MKILLLTEAYPPDLNPEALCVGKLVNGCLSVGHDVVVVTTEHESAKHDRTDTSPCWREMRGRTIRLPRPVGETARIIQGAAARIWGRLPTIGWWAYAALKRARELVRSEGFDCTITGYLPFKTALIGAALKEEFGIPWFVMFNDPSPWCLYPTPYGPGKPVTIQDRYIVRRMRKVLRNANAVLAPSERMAGYINEVYGNPFGERRIVMPHIGWSRPSNGQNRLVGLDILHSGIMMHGRENEQIAMTLRRALEEARALAIDVRVTFTGYVSGERSLPQKLKPLEDSIHWLPPIPYEDSLAQMNGAAALLLVEAVMEEGIFLPSKVADYAVSGRPLLMFSPGNGTVADLVGGPGHPGFLTQDPGVASERFVEFVKLAAAGDDLDRYRFPHPFMFHPEKVIDRLTTGIDKYRVMQAPDDGMAARNR